MLWRISIGSPLRVGGTQRRAIAGRWFKVPTRSEEKENSPNPSNEKEEREKENEKVTERPTLRGVSRRRINLC